MEQRTVTIKNFLRITDPYIHYRRMTYPPERENPTGVRQGMRQLDKYVDRFNLERPLNNGRKWEGVLDLY